MLCYRSSQSERRDFAFPVFVFKNCQFWSVFRIASARSCVSFFFESIQNQIVGMGLSCRGLN